MIYKINIFFYFMAFPVFSFRNYTNFSIYFIIVNSNYSNKTILNI